jgi:hypothetical protein
MSRKQERDRLVQQFRQGQKEKFFGAARSLCDLSLVLVGESAAWCQPEKDDEELVQTIQLILRRAEALHRMASQLQRDENRAVSALQDENVQLREAAETEVE